MRCSKAHWGTKAILRGPVSRHRPVPPANGSQGPARTWSRRKEPLLRPESFECRRSRGLPTECAEYKRPQREAKYRADSSQWPDHDPDKIASRQSDRKETRKETAEIPKTRTLLAPPQIDKPGGPAEQKTTEYEHPAPKGFLDLPWNFLLLLSISED